MVVPANGFPFGPVTDSWKAAVLFGQVALASLGGPLLGLVVGRWFPRRGVAPLAAVLLVAARTRRLRLVAGVLLVAAVVTCLLAMVTGLDHTLVNPLPSS